MAKAKMKKIQFGRYYLLLSPAQMVFLVLMPLVLLSLLLYKQNSNAMYEANIVLNPEVKEPKRPARGALKGYSRDFRRIYFLQYRQERMEAALKKRILLSSLTSSPLLIKFVEQYNLKPIFFEKLWDAEKQEWVKPEVGLIGSLFRLFRPPKNTVDVFEPQGPSDYQVFTMLRGAILIEQDLDSGFINVRLKLNDPIKAATILNQFVRFADNYMAQKRIQELNQKRAVLMQFLEREKNVGVKNEITAEISYIDVLLHTKTGDLDKTFHVIDPAMPPEKPQFKFSLILSVFVLFFGFLFALMVVLSRTAKKQKSVMSLVSEK